MGIVPPTMTARPAPALRFSLHLLLAACLLLQSTVAAAVGTTMAGSAGTNPDAVETTGQATGASPTRDAPPCHGAVAPASQESIADAPSAHGCCGDAAGLCEWVCASAPPLAVARIMLPRPPAPTRPEPPVAIQAPNWPVTTPLRPPIT